jgi:hypothetical protein
MIDEGMSGAVSIEWSRDEALGLFEWLAGYAELVQQARRRIMAR